MFLLGNGGKVEMNKLVAISRVDQLLAESRQILENQGYKDFELVAEETIEKEHDEGAGFATNIRIKNWSNKRVSDEILNEAIQKAAKKLKFNDAGWNYKISNPNIEFQEIIKGHKKAFNALMFSFLMILIAHAVSFWQIYSKNTEIQKLKEANTNLKQQNEILLNQQ